MFTDNGPNGNFFMPPNPNTNNLMENAMFSG